MTTVGTAPGSRRALRLPRVDTRLVVGLALVGLSVIGGLRLAASADDTVAVYAAARDLPADHVLRPGDLRVADIHAPGTVLEALVSASGSAPVGRVLRFPVAAGGLLASSTLGGAASGGRDITVPIAAEHALGGAIATGDRVDLLATFDQGTELARTLTVAESARVVDVVTSDGLFGQRDGELQALTLSVDPDEVVVVAFAVRNGEVDIVRAAPGGRGGRGRFDISQLP